MEPKRVKHPLTWTLRPVLPKNVMADTVDTVNVFVDLIIDRTCTSKIVKSLAEPQFAVPALSHLKRVKGQTVILMPAIGLSPEQCVAELRNKGFNFDGLSGRPTIVPVPRSVPKTCLQNQWARELWPSNFHPDKRLESVLAGKYFNDLELAAIDSHMRTALECAGIGDGVGAAVVDPTNGQIVAKSGDLRSEHPVKHAIMCVVDNVAKTQGGGAWGPVEPTNTSTDCDKTGPYLCTGYDIYVTREPCVMCAMALVHSRARRVFYGYSRPTVGGLGGLVSVHLLDGINHRFEVFAGVLEQECHAAAETVLMSTAGDNDIEGLKLQL
ncbi:Cytidine and deoxycytidylate deaminase domain,Cytidine deaminase-like [Cinara cedri]|uniref:Cytidine and deoxycytidylate deaminase domain,Cytidine deaminase-like n=1 Tax=Cinara cedri TaxID=506608 RepID=A0A5E4N991_9HEMI|nr:Cytidine and deoxycytidylate deaminase domain,Cytidine deaminase-like [Cinara cedri]